MAITLVVPHVVAAVREINNRYQELGKGGTYPGHGEDPPGEQYAVDFWTTNKAVHDKVFKWLIENGKRLGIWYIISWERIYSFNHPDRGVQAYTRYGAHPKDPSQGHRNHLHVSFYAKPPAHAEPTTGVPLMATADTVKVGTYKSGQALDGTGLIHINEQNDSSIVTKKSAGIDLTATFVVEGLAEGESVDIWWSREWKKSGAEDKIQSQEIPVTIRSGDAVQYRYATSLSVADTGWTACLRLRFSSNAKAAKLAKLHVRGWKLT